MIDETRKAELKALAKRLWHATSGHHNVVFFSGGFLFDALTLDRIDAWLDLGLQAVYLSLAGVLLWLQGRFERGDWKPTGILERVWPHERDLLHFLFGGLLSAYVIFYSRSGVGARGFLFFGAIAALLFSNELPKRRDWGHPVRLGVFAFCLASFLTYFLPVLVGRIGDGVFVGGVLLAALLFGSLVAVLAWPGESGKRLERALASGWAGALALAFVATLYFLRWIPPVPLALQYAGVYHGVERKKGVYELRFERRSRWDFFRKQDKPFYARPGDRLYCFVRIFAPARFKHDVRLDWRFLVDGNWMARDSIPLPIKGGRDEGYRGFAFKERFEAGDWRIDVVTEDGRVIGRTEVRVVKDDRTGARDWRLDRM
jgi:hypothetical protein